MTQPRPFRTHVSLEVQDLAESIAFYEALWGKPADRQEAAYANWRLDEPALMLSLVEMPRHDQRPALGGEHRGEAHFGVEVHSRESLAACELDLRDRGLSPRAEQGAVCCFATADKFWLTDPDGHPWEFWVKTGDADVMHPPEKSCCAAEEPSPTSVGSGCC